MIAATCVETLAATIGTPMFLLGADGFFQTHDRRPRPTHAATSSVAEIRSAFLLVKFSKRCTIVSQ